MPKVTFAIKAHDIKPGAQKVEILLDGVVCAIVYPTDKGVKLVSAHFAGDLVEQGFPEGVVMDNGKTFPHVPAVEFSFDPRPYRIEYGKLVRLTKQ